MRTEEFTVVGADRPAAGGQLRVAIGIDAGEINGPVWSVSDRDGLQKFAVSEAGLGHRSHFFHVGRR